MDFLSTRDNVPLRGDVPHDVSRHIRQPEVAAAVAVRELRVVQTHQVQDGGMQVVIVHRLLDGLETEVVGGALYEAALDAAAG